MAGDILEFPSSDDIDIPLDAPSADAGDDVEIAEDDEIAIEPDAVIPVIPVIPVEAAGTALAVTGGVIEILPPGFPLPRLVRFVPDTRLRDAIDAAVADAKRIDVSGNDGLQRADVGINAVKAALKAADEHFEDPASLAYDLHKGITGTRAAWKAKGVETVESLGKKMLAERRRLDQVAADERRKTQEAANRQAREDAAREARAAERSGAPPAVVEEMQRQAETIQAPPVAAAASAPAPLQNSAVAANWKSRLVGTEADADANPPMANLTPAQRTSMLATLQAILDGKAPLAAIDLNWKYLNARAKADKSTLAIPGIEAFDEGSLRSKGGRRS